MADIPFDILQTTCPSDIAAEVRELTPGSNEFSGRMQSVIQASIHVPDGSVLPADCYAMAVGFVLQNPNRPTAGDAVLMLSALRSVAPAERSRITDQAIRFLLGRTGDRLPPQGRFAALGDYRIDARNQLDARYAVPIGDPDDAPFHYALYAARFGDPDAVARIDAALRQAEADAHALNGLIIPITQIRPMTLRDIVLRFNNVTRRGIGVDGPGTGPSPQELLAPWAAMGQWERTF